jgi:hypothetical protein
MKILILLVLAAVANAAPRLKGQIALQPVKVALSEMSAKQTQQSQSAKSLVDDGPAPATLPAVAGSGVTPEFLPSKRVIGEGLDSQKVDEEAQAAMSAPPIPGPPCPAGCGENAAAAEEKKEETAAAAEAAAAEASTPTTTTESSANTDNSAAPAAATTTTSDLEENAGAHAEFKDLLGKAQAAIDASSQQAAPVAAEDSPIAKDAEFQAGLDSVDKLIARIKPHLEEHGAPAAPVAAASSDSDE